MDFFKYFDWARKIGYPANTLANIAPQGAVAVSDFPSASLVIDPGATADIEAGRISLRTSGRPVSIFFGSAMPSFGGDILVQSAASANNIGCVMKIYRNGVQICQREHRLIINPPPATAAAAFQIQSPLSVFNFTDVEAPAGNNEYVVYILRTTSSRQLVFQGRINALEL